MRANFCQTDVRKPRTTRSFADGIMARVREGLLLALLLAPVDAPAVEVGQVAPALTVPSIDARQMISLSDYRGKVVYLDFWSSWCTPCRRAMPELSSLRDQLSRDDFEVVAVNVD